MFDLTKPCAKCPFRTDCLKGWLGRPRAKEIISALLADKTFSCHQTVTYDDDDDGENDEHIPTSTEQHCAGATILLEKLERPNQMMRISERLGLYDHTKMDMDAPVFDNEAEFIKHHSKKAQR